MHFKRFEPNGVKLPAPRVSALPTLRWRSLRLLSNPPGANPAVRQVSYLRSRYALRDAYRLCGVGAQGALLAPAYHCRTMLDPALRLGAECLLYPLRPNLGVDLEAVERMLVAANGRVKAVLATHFFGFREDLAPLAALCERHGVALIEDCSHMLPSLGRDGRVGMAGPFSVWSPYKFYPCEDGGILQCNPGAPRFEGTLMRLSKREQVKDVVRLLRRSPKSIGVRAVSRVGAELMPLLAGPASAAGLDLDDERDEPSTDYQASHERFASSLISRYIMRRADERRIRERRRKRYLQWLKAASQWPNCRPLHAELPADCVPYMFPLHVVSPEVHFMPLKRLGVPVWRWDSMAVSEDPLASDLRLHLFQLPCHQELSDAEMAWMFSALGKVLRSPLALT